MCGVIGIFGGGPRPIQHGLESLKSRGPDALSAASFSFAHLGIARLAITDLENGAQPLRSRSGQVAVAYNGEIYNHRQIRMDFPAGTFRSGSDGEVVHALYERHGMRFADHLEGMYAVILLDLKRRRMVLANDPIGVKPLYWASRGGMWMAASTVDAFPQLLRSQVRRFPPGQIWATDGERTEIKPLARPEGSLLEELRRAVRSQIPDEVPWGCMFSGGLDSSLIAALARECTQEPIIAYTVGLPKSADVGAACALASQLGLRHRIVDVDPADLVDVIRQVVAATATYDPYIVPGGAATYLIARQAARDGLKVLLSGEGADELFAGYSYYKDIPFEQLNQALEEDQNDLGATECLRLDRCSMSHGVEVRVPYLSPRIVRFARQAPASQKIRRQADGIIVNKYCLREAARPLLPQWVVEREKSAFSWGTGMVDFIRGLASRQISPESFQRMCANGNGFRFQEPLDAWFYSIWKEQHSGLAGSWEEMVERGLARKASGGRV